MKILVISSITACVGAVYLMVASPSTRSYVCGRTGSALLDVISVDGRAFYVDGRPLLRITGDNPISNTLWNCYIGPYHPEFIKK